LQQADYALANNKRPDDAAALKEARTAALKEFNAAKA
jgi:hypothetical protein